MSRIEKDNLIVLEQYYREEFEDMVTFASHILESRTLAEVAVQDTFLIALNKIDRLAESPNAVGWLYITLKNVIKHMQRNRQKQILRIVALEEIKEIPTDDASMSLWITKDACKDPDIGLLYKFYVENNSLKELAEEYGITVGACKMRIKRAKGRVKEKKEKFS